MRVTVVEKPARTLLVIRGRGASDYFAYCEEVGCEVYDQLLHIPGRMGEPMGLWLPQALRHPGTSEYVMGVEMPADYTDDAADLISLPAHTYLAFQGPPYAEPDMGTAIGTLIAYADCFDPTPLGLAWSQAAPRYQLAPIGERGYIEARPVVEV